MGPLITLLTLVAAAIVSVALWRYAEAKLRRSESRYRELVDSLPHHIYRVDNADRYVAVNAAAASFLGRRKGEVIGKAPLELGVAPEMAAVWAAENAKVRSSGSTWTVDIRTGTNGDTRYLRNILTATRDDRGHVAGVIGIGIDITEQRVAEAVTRRLLSAVEQLDEVMFTTDIDGLITYVNPAFERVYGFSRAEAIGQTPRILKSGDRLSGDYDRFWSELTAGRSVCIEYTNRAKDGSRVNVIGTATPVFDGGSLAGFVAVQQDVTARNLALEERRRLDEQVQRLARMEALGTLAGGIAHDFNNILSIIMSHVEVAERSAHLRDRFLPAIDTIKQAVRRGAGVSRQILTFARQTGISLEVVDVVPLVRELGSMLAETLPRTISVSVHADPTLPHVLADAGQLHQALLNLCLNARDAMPHGGTLRISADIITAEGMKTLLADAEPSDSLCIVVSDDGLGMDAETRKRIFEPFFTTKEQGRGTGLGLAVVYGIVNAHHGFVDLESEPGVGTTFRIYLPTAPAAPATTVENPAPVGLFEGTETVLLIDDESAILEGLSMELTGRGYRVMTACDGPRALDICRGGQEFPHVIVTDLGMPNMAASDLVRALREVLPEVPVLGMTGYVDPAFHQSILAAGVDRILQKPFDATVLLRNLREILGSPRRDAVQA